MSYAAIANHLGGIITKSTVSKHLQSLEGFATTKSRILPQLSKDCMERRKRFCEAFFIFWHSAKCLKSKIKLIVTHMDEKWVHAVVTRTNIKLLENYNVGKRYNYAHHKNYMDQVMFIIVNGFVPYDNNLLGNGGRCIKIECIAVGDYEECKRSSYKRVTDEDDGNFTYPRIPENLEKKRENTIGETKLCVAQGSQMTINFR